MKKIKFSHQRLALSAAVALQFVMPDALAQTVNVNPGTSYQLIRGFGGHNGAGWIADLTPAQVDTAFGNGPGQMGLSLMRMRIDPSSGNWSRQVPTAKLAKAKGVTLFATPWSPPASMKTNNNVVGGRLKVASYADYATHLLNFASYMKSNGAELYGLSVQNEPDIVVTYESCEWNANEFIDFLKTQGPRFDAIKLMAPESFNFKKTLSDPLLNDASAAPQFDIVSGHLYGPLPSDYPLARSKGKELWMTEHYIDSNADANDWLKALPVAVEVHRSMAANYNAYVWWYIRRSYGLMTEDSLISKRGHIMAQYAKYVRPGYVRIAATEKPHADVFVSAYKSPEGKIAIVSVNNGTSQRKVDLTFGAGVATGFAVYRTTATENGAFAGTVPVVSGVASVTMEPASVYTFVAQQSTDTTGNFRVMQSGLSANRFTGQFTGTVSLTNITAAAITGQLQLALQDLTTGVSLDNKTGMRDTVPYITVPVTALAPGATVTVSTSFANPAKSAISYTPKIYSVSN